MALCRRRRRIFALIERYLSHGKQRRWGKLEGRCERVDGGGGTRIEIYSANKWAIQMARALDGRRFVRLVGREMMKLRQLAGFCAKPAS